MQRTLRDELETRLLGRALAGTLTSSVPCTILLQGSLGAGKTTLVRGLVESLPGGDESEISSPSFNIFNVYPTTPEVVHFDLYRTVDSITAENLSGYFADPIYLVLVEWVDNLPADYWPDSYILVHLDFAEQGRIASLRGRAQKASQIIKKTGQLLDTLVRTERPDPSQGE